MTEAANGMAEAASRGAASGEAPAAALRWVCRLLHESAIPFQLTGDIAAAAYGAAGPIRSLELFIAAEHVPALLRGAKEHVVDCPWRRRDDAWDRVALSLSFDGVTIDVCVAEAARFREAATGAWRDAGIDLAASVSLQVRGVVAPVMPREQLLDQQRRLDREVDRPPGRVSVTAHGRMRDTRPTPLRPCGFRSRAPAFRWSLVTDGEAWAGASCGLPCETASSRGPGMVAP